MPKFYVTPIESQVKVALIEGEPPAGCVVLQELETEPVIGKSGDVIESAWSVARGKLDMDQFERRADGWYWAYPKK